MFDLSLRPLKDTLIVPLLSSIPSSLTPLHLTALAFLSGLLSCLSASQCSTTYSLIFWALNRILDCLDGGIARYRGQESDLGGFLDLLGDFIVYSLLPIAVVWGQGDEGAGERGGERVWMAVAVLEASFHVNNFVLFYVAAVAEKERGKKKGDGERGKEEKGKERDRNITSVVMKPALVEGAESALMFTAMLMLPQWVEEISWGMAALVSVGIAQRVVWVVKALG